jgi:hypothetical protein
MSEPELKRLAQSWIRMQRAKRNSAAYEAEFWAFETLSKFCRSQPEDAWQVIVSIYDEQPEEIILANLAAGPAEDLLVYHGSVALPWMAAYCAGEPGIAKVLRMVWRNAMPDDVWDGLKRLIEKHA